MGRDKEQRGLGRRLIALVALLSLAACGTTAPVPQKKLATTDRDDMLSKNIVARRPYEPLVVMPAPEISEESAVGTPLAAFSGRDTPVKDVLLTMFKDSDLNLLVDSNVAGTATYDIKATTVEHAFDSLTRYLDLAYEFDGDFVRVRDHERRTFNLDFLNSASGGEGGGASLDVWGRVKEDLPTLVGTEGQVIVNAVAGTVQVDAKPSRVRIVEQYLTNMFERVTNQVTIEARILEVRLRDEFRLGVNWQLLGGLLRGDYSGTLGGGQFAGLGAASGGDAFNLGLLNTNDFSVFVDALETQGQVRVLSSPRVSTMNNVPASIRVVDQIPVIEREIIDSEGGVRTQFDIRFVEAGIRLDVTPQIGKDEHITVQVNPVVTEQTGTVTTPDGLQTEPILSTREAQSVLRVRDGQAMVIGGLRSVRKDETTTGVPGATRFPLLGAAGRNQVQQAEEVELVVLLVPRIMNAAWMLEDHRRSTASIKSVRRCFLPSTMQMNQGPKEDWKCGFLMGEAACWPQPVRQTTAAVRPTQAAANGRMTITRTGFGGQLYRRAVASFTDGHYQQAVNLLEQAIALDGKHVDAWIYAGLAHYRLGNTREARIRLDRALRLRPNDAVALSARGVMELNGGSPAAARSLLERAQRLNPNAVTGNNLAAAYIAQGDYAGAAAILGTLPLNETRLPEAHVNRAYVYFHQGRPDLAQIEITSAQEKGINPREPRVRAIEALLSRSARRR